MCRIAAPEIADPEIGDPDVGDASPAGLVTNLGLGPASLSNTSSNTSLLPRVTGDAAVCRKYVGKTFSAGWQASAVTRLVVSAIVSPPGDPISLRRSKKQFFSAGS